ncbi:hypothetical protein B0H14DRAFT_3426642 [Mycena olivaceomarginata]|nr:hypothetical protein B0H14DRAFT_3426642 [Mycena olivaceomarginata]
MSRDDLISLARRYQAMAGHAIAAANRRSVEHELNKFEHGFNKSRHSSKVNPSVIVDNNSVEDLVRLSPAIPTGEGPSRKMGKGPDPRNWGGLDFLDDFSEKDLEAQRGRAQGPQKW